MQYQHTHLATETGSSQAQPTNRDSGAAKKQAQQRQKRRQRKATLKPGDDFPAGPNLFTEFSFAPLVLERILTPRETRVWSLVYRWLQTTGHAFECYDRIAEAIGVSRRQAMRLVKSLERKGLLRITARWRDGRQTSNEYHLLWHEVFANGDPDTSLGSVADVTPEDDADVTPLRREILEKREEEKQDLASYAETFQKKPEPAAKELPQQPVVSQVPEQPLPKRKPPQVQTKPIEPNLLPRLQHVGLREIGGRGPSENTLRNISNSVEPLRSLAEDQRRLAIEHIYQAWAELARSRRAEDWGLVVWETKRMVNLALAGELYDRTPQPRRAEVPFTVDDLREHLLTGADGLRAHGSHDPVLVEAFHTLNDLAVDAENHIENLENLERNLTSLENKIVAALRTGQTPEDLAAIRAGVAKELNPYRGKMTSEQMAMLERRYLDTTAMERARIPRLSLFYIQVAERAA